MSECLQQSGVTKKNKDPITITDRALDRVRYLLDQKNNSPTNISKTEESDEGYDSEDDEECESENDSGQIKAIGIRVLIKQRGCSGLKYDIEYAYDIRPFESVIEESCSDGQKVKVLIDPKSLMFMLGSEMDYVEEKFSSGFVFKNPREKGKCGCGESFHV